MKPVSMRRRIVYLVLSVLAFLLTVPLAGFYASGYRLDDFSLVETGGVYLSTPQSDVVVTINGEEEGVSSLFVRSFYKDDLAPEWYTVQATKEGYHVWSKKLKVEPKIVTDVQAFMVPQTLTIRDIVLGELGEDTASTTRAVSETEYELIIDTFATTTPGVVIENADGATSTASALRANVALVVQNGDLIARWTRDARTIPSYFCVEPSSCEPEFYIEKGKGTVTGAAFFAGGVVYTTKESGVFLAELDARTPSLVVLLYSRPGAQFRIINGSLVVKDGRTYYDVSGF